MEIQHLNMPTKSVLSFRILIWVLPTYRATAIVDKTSFHRGGKHNPDLRNALLGPRILHRVSPSRISIQAANLSLDISNP
jgi:hypothetical protein